MNKDEKESKNIFSTMQLDLKTKHVVIVLGDGQAAVWNGTTLEQLTRHFTAI